MGGSVLNRLTEPWPIYPNILNVEKEPASFRY